MTIKIVLDFKNIFICKDCENCVAKGDSEICQDTIIHNDQLFDFFSQKYTQKYSVDLNK